MAGNVWLFAQDIKSAPGPRKHQIHMKCALELLLSHIGLTIERKFKVE